MSMVSLQMGHLKFDWLRKHLHDLQMNISALTTATSVAFDRRTSQTRL